MKSSKFLPLIFLGFGTHAAFSVALPLDSVLAFEQSVNAGAFVQGVGRLAVPNQTTTYVNFTDNTAFDVPSDSTPGATAPFSQTFKLGYSPGGGGLVFNRSPFGDLPDDTGNGIAQTGIVRDDSSLVANLTAGQQADLSRMGGIYLRLFAPVGVTVTVSGLVLDDAYPSAVNLGTAFMTGYGASSSFVTPVLGSYSFTGVGSTLETVIDLGKVLNMSDGFVLKGSFAVNGVNEKAGFQIFTYAPVPEPATVAFGLAMVGGLGLLEIRRRKNS